MVLKGHKDGVISVDIHLNEELIVSGGRDKTVRVWKYKESLSPIMNFREH